MNNRYVIELGSYRDKKSLPLATKLGTHIPNVQRPEVNDEIRRSSVEGWRTHRPQARLRSWSHTYNCMGMVFAARRTHVGIESLPLILREDGFRKLSGPDEALLGDLVVYTLKGQPEHVGLIARVEVDLGLGSREFLVLSKWGYDGEYLHSLGDLPQACGTPTEFWTERR